MRAQLILLLKKEIGKAAQPESIHYELVSLQCLITFALSRPLGAFLRSFSLRRTASTTLRSSYSSRLAFPRIFASVLVQCFPQTFDHILSLFVAHLPGSLEIAELQPSHPQQTLKYIIHGNRISEFLPQLAGYSQEFSIDVIADRQSGLGSRPNRQNYDS